NWLGFTGSGFATMTRASGDSWTIVTTLAVAAAAPLLIVACAGRTRGSPAPRSATVNPSSRFSRLAGVEGAEIPGHGVLGHRAARGIDRVDSRRQREHERRIEQRGRAAVAEADRVAHLVADPDRVGAVREVDHQRSRHLVVVRRADVRAGM